MSSRRFKTTYQTEGAWGSTETNTLYVEHHGSSDYTHFYDENGGHILSVPDTLDNNILEAINKLYAPYKNDNGVDLIDGVEIMTPEETKILTGI